MTFFARFSISRCAVADFKFFTLLGVLTCESGWFFGISICSIGLFCGLNAVRGFKDEFACVGVSRLCYFNMPCKLVVARAGLTYCGFTESVGLPL